MKKPKGKPAETTATEPVILPEPDEPPASAPEDAAEPTPVAAELAETPPEGDVVDVDGAAPARDEGPRPADTHDEIRPAPEPVQAAQQPAPAQRSSFMPALLGGVLAAGIGFGTAQVIKPDGWPFPGQPDSSAALAEQAKAIAALEETVAGLKAENQSAQADLAARLDAAAEGLAGLGERLAAIEATPAAAEVDLAPVMAEIEALKAQLASQPDVAADITAQIEAANAAAAARLAEAEANAARMRDEAERLAMQAAARQAATALLAAADAGQPFAGELQALSSAGVTVPDALTGAAEAGIPTLAALRDGFADPARAALAASIQVEAGDALTDRLAAFLKTQTNARSLEPREGDDPDAILSRAEAAVQENDLQAALDLIATLPEGGQAAMATWAGMAGQRLSVMQAIQDITQSLAE